MKEDDFDTKLGTLDLPGDEQIRHQQELKIPLLSYKRSSRVGLWLLVVPVIAVITVLLKYELGMSSPFLDVVKRLFGVVDRSPVLTYLIPLVLVGFPVIVMTINLLAICHFAHMKEKNEFVITVKIRMLNIALFLLSFAVFVYFLLPDRLSF